MMTMNSNIEPLAELWVRIVELEEEISDRARWNRLLDTLKKLFTEAQDHHRKGNMQEARLTLNSGFRLVERTKRELSRSRTVFPTLP
jgi:regulator of sirC expression with transglutaminase-like and TPR domain